jgi:type IV pilus assembly protein PilO
MQLGLRPLIFLCVLLAVPLASYFLVFRPQNREIARAKAEIELKEKMLEKLRAATEQTADLERANIEIREAIDAIEARLPSNKEIDTVLREVAQIAARNDLKMPVFKKDDKSLVAGSALEQALEVELSGDFDGFYRFLLELERVPRITRLSDLKVTRTDDNNGAMKAKCTLSIYYQGDKLAGAESAGGDK